MAEINSQTVTENSKRSLADYVKQSIRPAVPDQTELPTSSQMSEPPWQLDILENVFVQNSDVHLASNGNAVQFNTGSRDMGFLYREQLNLGNLSIDVSATGTNNETRQKWVNASSMDFQDFRNRIFSDQEIKLKVTVDSMYLINQQDGSYLDLRHFFRLVSDGTLDKTGYEHDTSTYGRSRYSSQTNAITFRVPTSLEDLFSLMHEVGHAIRPPSDYKIKDLVYNSLRQLFRKSSTVDVLSRKGVNLTLKKKVESERSAWAGAYWMLKALRTAGFINFDDKRFLAHVGKSLRSYDEENEGKPGRITYSTFFSKDARHETRASSSRQQVKTSQEQEKIALIRAKLKSMLNKK